MQTPFAAKGMYIGAACEESCAARLHHVVCEPTAGKCACERNYPVSIGLTKGCAKCEYQHQKKRDDPHTHHVAFPFAAKKLGEQCFYHEACAHSDPNSLCVQVKHNALCQCADGYHSVTYAKPTKRIFCTQGRQIRC